MEDRHVKEIAEALKKVAAALTWVGFAIIMASSNLMCGILTHH